MNESYLEILFHKYRDKIIGFFVQFLGDQELAKDLMQDVFVKLLQSKSDFDQISDMDGYIYQMCRNRAYDHLKKAYQDKDYKEYLWNQLDFETQFVKPKAEQNMESEHYHAILEKSLSQLSEQQRLIFNLSKRDGLSHKKIAEKLNLSPITVRNHLHRAIKNLRSTTNPDVDFISIIWVCLTINGVGEIKNSSNNNNLLTFENTIDDRNENQLDYTTYFPVENQTLTLTNPLIESQKPRKNPVRTNL